MKNRLKDSIQPFFSPSSIAIIGASETEHSVGKTLTLNLIKSSFKGKIFLINPKRGKIFKKKAYPSVLAVKEKIELAVIATPAQTVPALLMECGKKGISAVIVISAGFKELGPKGDKLEKEIVRIARAHNIRLIGPNCLGVMNPLKNFNATFASGMALKGKIAFLSQSGAMCTAVLDWSRREKIGFSAFISVGSMADVAWPDLIDYLGDDPNTKSILLYMESIGDPRAFIKAASRVSQKKPIVVIKAGRTEEAAQAAVSHTGSMAGSDAVFDVAMERSGVMRVHKIAELFYLARILSYQSLPEGPHLTIITNAGGPSVLATDAAILSGAKITPPSKATIEKLNQFLPAAWSHSNPIDILGDARADRYQKTLEVILKDKSSDGVLVILSPQDMTEAKESALAVKKLSKRSKKPILASWMGGDSVAEGIAVFSDNGIPQFAFPDYASETFGKLWQHQKAIKGLREKTKNLSKPDYAQRAKKASIILEQAQSEKRTILSEAESKKFLEIWGIPIVKTHIATSLKEAENLAEKMGYPVVVKLYSHTITHKTDVGGVKLNLQNKQSVKEAFETIEKNVLAKHKKSDFLGVTIQKMITMKGYEVILGFTTDAQFGPVMLFGLGGELVEVFKDTALALPPLNLPLAHDLMAKTKVYQALQGVRGKKSIQLDKLAEIMVLFSYMMLYHPRIKECDINPLLASPEDIIALDGRIVLYEASTPQDQIPKSAIPLDN